MFPGGRGFGHGNNGGPFSGFPNLNDPFGGFGLFGGGGGRSLIEDFFGHDLFEDPFFRRPFGGLFGPPAGLFGAPAGLLGGNVPGAGLFGAPAGLLGGNVPGGILSNGFSSESFGGSRAHGQTEHRRGPVIEELPDDHEGPLPNGSDSPGTEPVIEHPDDADDDDSTGNPVIEPLAGLWRSEPGQNSPLTRTFCYQSSTVSGPDGVCFSSSKRRMNANGLMKEEFHEMDRTAGTEIRSVAKGMGEKAHMVSRKRSAEERESTLETLQNLSAEEAVEFDRTWERHAERSIMGSRFRQPQLSHPAGSTRQNPLYLPNIGDPSDKRETGSGSRPSKKIHRSEESRGKK